MSVRSSVFRMKLTSAKAAPQTPDAEAAGSQTSVTIPLGCLMIAARCLGLIWPPDGVSVDSSTRPGSDAVSIERFGDLARRGGIAIHRMAMDLRTLRSHHLPAIVLLKDNRAVVVERRSRNGRVLFIGVPENGGVTRVRTADLAADQSGTILLASRMGLATADGMPRSSNERGWFWGAFAQYWAQYSLVFVCAFFINVIAVIVPLTTMALYDRIIPNMALSSLMAAMTGLAIVLLLDFGLKTLRTRVLDEISQRIDRRMYARIMAHVLAARIADKPDSPGGFASQMGELEQLSDTINSALGITIIDSLFAIAILGIIALIAGPVALVPAVAILLIIVCGIAMQSSIRRAAQRAQVLSAEKQGLMVETIAGIEAIKLLGAERAREGVLRAAVAEWSRGKHKSQNTAKFLADLNGSIGQAAYVGVLVAGTLAIFNNMMTMGALFAVSLLTSKAVSPMAALAASVARFSQTKEALATFNRIMRTPVDQPIMGIPVHRVSKGTIDFREVSFAYPAAKLPTLREVSFRIGAGDRIAIIGRSGSGKSTIAKIAAGLYDPTQGIVLISGIDARQIPDAMKRRGVSYMQQDIDLFRGTLFENLTLGLEDFDRESVLEAAAIAGVDDFARAHPQGYAMAVQDRGRNLSIGQRQSVALARSLLNKPKVLILDEPTSGMDNAAEAAIVDKLRRFIDPDQTLIVISHRTTLLDLANRLILVDGGQITADGPKEMVLAKLREANGGGAASPMAATPMARGGVRS